MAYLSMQGSLYINFSSDKPFKVVIYIRCKGRLDEDVIGINKLEISLAWMIKIMARTI